jgi:hypothetical protein
MMSPTSSHRKQNISRVGNYATRQTFAACTDILWLVVAPDEGLSKERSAGRSITTLSLGTYRGPSKGGVISPRSGRLTSRRSGV